MLVGYLAGYRGTADALLSRIRELESLDYPTPLSRTLLLVLKGAVIESAKVVDSLTADAGEIDENAVIRHGQLLSWIHTLVHLVSTSVGNDVPRWAIQPMKSEIEKFLKSDVDIIIVGGNEGGNFAYDYRLDRVNGILSHALGSDVADKLTAQLPRHMAVFHFPFGERDNVLAHGAFFHEVGHQIDIAILGISERVAREFVTENDGEIRARIREIANALFESAFGKAEGEQKSIGDEQSELLLEQLVKSVQGALVNWAREFCADLLATRILGPAYAMVVVTSPALLSNLHHHSNSHPATLLRLKLILQLLASTKAGDFFTDCSQALETAGINELLKTWRTRCTGQPDEAFKWHQPVAVIGAEQLHPMTMALADSLGAKLLEAVVDATTGHDYYTPTQLNADVAEVLPALESWLTINERIEYKTRTHTPNGIGTIFNVGIACYLRQKTEEARTRLSRLLRKSIELSQIQRQLQA